MVLSYPEGEVDIFLITGDKMALEELLHDIDDDNTIKSG